MSPVVRSLPPASQPPTPAPGGKQLIEIVIAWASVAYAAGFVTVVAHTARLGLPVLELIKPIYIWIGAPFAVVFFFTRHLWRLVRQRVSYFRSEYTAIRAAAVTTPEARLKGTLDALVDISSVSLFGLLLRAADVASLTLKVFESLATRVKEAKSLRYIARITRIALVAALVLQFINRVLTFVVLVGLVPAALIVYVWFIYPMIPQSLGGGKPTPVVLLLDRTKIPILSVDGVVPDDTTAGQTLSSTVPTRPVNLLYSTKDELFVSPSDGQVVSLPRSAVHATIWKPSPD